MGDTKTSLEYCHFCCSKSVNLPSLDRYLIRNELQLTFCCYRIRLVTTADKLLSMPFESTVAMAK